MDREAANLSTLYSLLREDMKFSLQDYQTLHQWTLMWDNFEIIFKMMFIEMKLKKTIPLRMIFNNANILPIE